MDDREDTVCCCCGEHVPCGQAIPALKDPDAWVHINCPAMVSYEKVQA